MLPTQESGKSMDTEVRTKAVEEAVHFEDLKGDGSGGVC